MICKGEHEMVGFKNSAEVETRKCTKCDAHQYFWADPSTGASGWKNYGKTSES